MALVLLLSIVICIFQPITLAHTRHTNEPIIPSPSNPFPNSGHVIPSVCMDGETSVACHKPQAPSIYREIETFVDTNKHKHKPKPPTTEPQPPSPSILVDPLVCMDGETSIACHKPQPPSIYNEIETFVDTNKHKRKPKPPTSEPQPPSPSVSLNPLVCMEGETSVACHKPQPPSISMDSETLVASKKHKHKPKPPTSEPQPPSPSVSVSYFGLTQSKGGKAPSPSIFNTRKIKF